MLVQIHQQNVNNGHCEFISQLDLPKGDRDERIAILKSELERVKHKHPLREGFVWAVVPEDSVFFVKTLKKGA